MIKRRTDPFLLFLLCILAGCHVSPEQRMKQDLVAIEPFIHTAPRIALDRLDSLDKSGMHGENLHYYELLRIIALENNFVQVKSDTAIGSIYNFYKDRYNADTLDKAVKYNYGKAALYYAVIKKHIYSKDTLIYRLLKDAQMAFQEIRGPDYYRAVTHTYLALINNSYRNPELADMYYDRAFAEYRELGDSTHIAFLKIDRAFMHLLSTQRFDLAFETLQELEKEDLLLNDEIRYACYNIYAACYILRQDYVSAIKYAKLQCELKNKVRRGIDKAKINYSLSKYYTNINELDSAIIYANLAIDRVMERDSVSEKLLYYFRNVGDIYFKAKIYDKSSIAYRNAYLYSLNSAGQLYRRKQKEFEKKYDAFLAESRHEIHRAEEWADILLKTVMALIITLLLLLLFYKNRIGKVTRKNLELKHQALEQELKQSQSMIEVVSVSLGVLPTFIEKVNDLSAKIFSTDPTLYEGFQKEINSVKSEIRKRLLELVNNEALEHTNPVLKHLYTLSNQEKIIVLLLRQNYSTKYIASILNISPSSIRGSKVKIKAKIRLLETDESIKNEILEGLQ